MENSKPILVFAHRGEAQSFLKLDNLISVKTPFENLYECDSYFLLICGEGFQSTLERLSATCGLLGSAVESIINMGIAGSLTDKYTVGQIISLRTAYFCHGDQLQFKSYTTSDSAAAADCVCVTERALAPELENKLVVYGDLVDREAWACGSVANLFKIPFYSYKYISDRIQTNSQEICQRLKETAEVYSSELYEFYQQLYLAKESGEKREDQLKGFYFSATQKRQFNGLIKSLKIKQPEFEIAESDLMTIRESIQLPKLRTGKLLELLENTLNPFKHKLNNAIDGTLAPLKMAKFQVNIDKQFENPELKLKASVQTQADIENLIRGLNRFSLKEYHNIFEGDISGV